MFRLILLMSMLLLSNPANAYIGPGMGGSVVVTIVGFFAAILLGFWAILYYPIKRSLTKRKEKTPEEKPNDDDA